MSNIAPRLTLRVIEKNDYPDGSINGSRFP